MTAERPRVQSFAERITVPRAFASIMAITVVFTAASAAVMRIVEPETFRTFGQAVWWAIQTVSTVGYGDKTPVSPDGRVVATIVMIFGVALVPTATSVVVAILLEQNRKRAALARGDRSDG